MMKNIKLFFTLCLIASFLLSGCKMHRSQGVMVATNNSENSMTGLYAASPSYPGSGEVIDDATMDEIEKIYSKISKDGVQTAISKTFKIAVVLPMSGKHKIIGEQILDGIKMAVLDSGSNDIIVMPFDEELIENNGVSELVGEIADSKVDIILGPLFSKNTKLLVSNFKKIAAPIITFSNDPTLAKLNGVEVFGFDANDRVMTALGYAVKDGRVNIGTLLQTGPNLVALNNDIINKISSLKMNRITSAYYTSDAKHVNAAVEQIAKNQLATFNVAKDGSLYTTNVKDVKKNNNDVAKVKKRMDVILTDAGGRALDVLLSEMDSHKILDRNIKVISISEQVIDPSDVNEGVYFATYDNSRYDVFRDFYSKFYGVNPTKFSALGYDATGVVISLIQSGNFTYDAMHDKRGFVGVTGEFMFAKNGIVKRFYSVYQVKNGMIHKVL